jgi:uncharacterized membrane protein YwaF
MKIITFPLTSAALLLVLLSADITSSIWLFQNPAASLPFVLHGMVSLLASLTFYWEKRSNKATALDYFFYGFQFFFVLLLPVIGLIGAFIFANHSYFINHKERHDED